MKKILIISQYFTPDITAAAYRIKDLYNVIIKSDQYEVDVITTYPHKSNNKEQVESGENIHRIDINKNFKNKFLNYLYQYFYFSLNTFRLSFKIGKAYDVVFVTSPPIFTLIPAYYISKKSKAKYVIDIRDIWPDSAVDSEMISNKSIFYKITKKLEIFMYKKANIITCVSKLMHNYIFRYTDINKIKVLYNGVSEEDISNIKDLQDKKINFKKDKLKIFYAGNIGLGQNLNVLIKAFEIAPSLNDKFELHLIGEGVLREKLLLKAKNKNINIQYYGNIKKDKAIKILYQNADVLYLALNKKESFKNTIPSKVFDYLLVNKPIVYGIEGEGREILGQLMCGEHFDVNSIEKLIGALNKIGNNYDYYKQNAQSNFDYVTSNFNRTKNFKAFIDNL